MAGAVALIKTPGATAEAEIDRICTPGGLTIRGLNALEQAGFSAAVIQGLMASLPKETK
jgi:pyrroline-5-carboxylate reductase